MALFAGVKAAMSNAMPQHAPPPPPPMWHTRLTQHDSPAEMSHCLYAWCCPQCTAAAAKSKADKSHPCFNFMCFTPIGMMSWVRLGYHIPGVCGDDICYGMWCMPCMIRRIYTESIVRGPNNQPPTQGSNTNEWKATLFDCTPCELCNAAFCPCCVVHEIRQNLQPEAAESCCFDSMCILPTAMYGQVRHSYGIITDFPVCEDVCVPLACFPCALNQAHKMTMWVKSHGLPTASPTMPFTGMPMGGGGPQYQRY